MQFEFATASRILFGSGRIQELPGLCRNHDGPVLLVTGRTPNRWDSIIEALQREGIPVVIFSLAREPHISDVRAGAQLARDSAAKAVLSIGGGSAIDAGKAISAMAQQPGDVLDYLEVIGQGKPLDAPALPFIAVPTTAGTGAEVTRNAVLASPEHRVKVSLRHASMLPRVALVDPDLTLDTPNAVTAATGMDALTQCLEAFVSCRAQPMTDALSIDGIRRAARSLERVCDDPTNAAAREDMALAALFSGMALANAGLGAVHGFAAPIGGMLEAPHGNICAALLAPVWEGNLCAVMRRGNTATQQKFRQAATLLMNDANASADAAIAWLHRLAERLQIPRLAALGLSQDSVEEVALNAAKASSMKGNPVALDQTELIAILRNAL